MKELTDTELQAILGCHNMAALPHRMNAARAAIAADRALNAADRDVMRQAPEGWKLAPVEPTQAMVDAWESSRPDPTVKETAEEANRRHATSDWKAMLAAAPTPPVEQQYVTYVDGGALKMALNVLRRAGKNEVADELEKTAVRSTPAEQQGTLTSVTKEDANKYCLILRELGMEEEGDPVAEVMRLKRLAEQGEQEPRPAFSKDALWGMKHALAKLRAKVEALERFSFGMGKQLVGRDEVLAEIDKMGGGV